MNQNTQCSMNKTSNCRPRIYSYLFIIILTGVYIYFHFIPVQISSDAVNIEGKYFMYLFIYFETMVINILIMKNTSF